MVVRKKVPLAVFTSLTWRGGVILCWLWFWLAYIDEHAASYHPGYLWNLQVKLQPIVNLLPDKGRLMDFLLQRKECKVVVLSVCSQSKCTDPSPWSVGKYHLVIYLFKLHLCV